MYELFSDEAFIYYLVYGIDENDKSGQKNRYLHPVLKTFKDFFKISYSWIERFMHCGDHQTKSSSLYILNTEKYNQYNNFL